MQVRLFQVKLKGKTLFLVSGGKSEGILAVRVRVIAAGFDRGLRSWLSPERKLEHPMNHQKGRYLYPRMLRAGSLDS